MKMRWVIASRASSGELGAAALIFYLEDVIAFDFKGSQNPR
jgi:hypothetical protein